MFNTKLSLRIGRKNLHDKGFGNNWLIGDGTPMDGSKTFYYNAMRFTYKFKHKQTLDGVLLQSFQNHPFVIYSEIEKSVTNITDETGGFVWYKDKKIKTSL